MSEGTFCRVEDHILIINICKNFNIALFLRNKEVAILDKILLDDIFSGVQLTLSYLHKRSHRYNCL